MDSRWSLGLRRVCLALFAASLLGCDHATKLVAKETLSGGPPVPLVGGLLDLRFTMNDDVGFGLFRTLAIPRSPAILVAVASLGILAIGWQLFVARGPRIAQIGYAAILAGALGNVLDRLTRGYVVDFIHITHWPVFNVADIAIVVGMALVGLNALRRVRQPPAPPLLPPPR